MITKYSVHPYDFKTYTTQQVRNEFLIENLFEYGKQKTVYSHPDRVIIGGICPDKPAFFESGKEIASDFFLQRREVGIINIGGKGVIKADGTEYSLNTKDGLYIGMGIKEVIFSSEDINNPAKFYFISTPAHTAYPVQKINIAATEPLYLGSSKESNKRILYKLIHPQGVKSCQLVMGMTILEPGSVWNTMPCHTHERRVEVYLYFGLSGDNAVFHFMGEPDETRHIVLRNEEAVISPSWSIHSGAGTGSYTFIWAMAGENQAFDDMDAIKTGGLK